MKAKAGMIVTEMSGSLGGHTFQNSKGGFQIRNKPIPTGKPSASQTLIRSYNTVLQAGWRALTSAQQKIWNNWPVTHGIMNAKGDKSPLSGHSLWMKYQFDRLAQRLPFLPSPSFYLSNYFGPELIYNGNFLIVDGWSVGAQQSIHDGRYYLNGTIEGTYYGLQPLPGIPDGSKYRIKVDVYPVANTLRTALFGNAYTQLFAGHNEFDTIPLVAWTYFIFVYLTTDNLSLDNVSMKKILI